MPATSRPVSIPASQYSARHVAVAVGAFLEMIGASVLLSGLSILTAPIVAEMYTGADGRPANGGQAGFLLYFTLMTFAIVVPLLLFSGKLLARYGARIMLTVGGVVMTLGLLVFAAAQNSVMFYLAGIVIGAGYGLSLAVVPPALVNTWFVRRRGLVLGLVLAGTGVGGLAWAILGPQLAASMGWRTVVVVMAAVLALCTLLPPLLLIRNEPSDVQLLPYGAGPHESHDSLAATVQATPGLTLAQALRGPGLWLASGAFFLFGMVVAITQILSISFKTAAYARPTAPLATQPAGEVSFYSMLFVVWLVCLVAWKPVLGILNDRIGTIGMMIVSLALMGAALVYMPHMVFGTPVLLMYLAMAFMSSGISNATVTPPLVVGRVVGPKEYGKVFAVAAAFYYAGNAIGAPLWGALGNAGRYSWGMYASPVVLAVVVLLCVLAIRLGTAQQRALGVAADTPRPRPTVKEGPR